jgi:hypothetical protein
MSYLYRISYYNFYVDEYVYYKYIINVFPLPIIYRHIYCALFKGRRIYIRHLFVLIFG